MSIGEENTRVFITLSFSCFFVRFIYIFICISFSKFLYWYRFNIHLFFIFIFYYFLLLTSSLSQREEESICAFFFHGVFLCCCFVCLFFDIHLIHVHPLVMCGVRLLHLFIYSTTTYEWMHYDPAAISTISL